MHAPFDTLSFIAFEAAFTKGEEWRQELLKYLRENKKWLDERISRIPDVYKRQVVTSVKSVTQDPVREASM